MSQQVTESARLRPDVVLYAAVDGHVLRVGDTHHQVHLDEPSADDLLDALVTGHHPRTAPAAGALASLVSAGLVDPATPRWTVDGDGRLATAVRAALVRMGADPAPTGGRGAATLLAVDAPGPADLPAGRACWSAGRTVVLSPPAVSARDVAARRRAATRHRATDPRATPRPGGRRVEPASPVLAGAGLQLAAALVAADLLRPDPHPHEALVVDLVALTCARHRVLPLPPAPR